MPLFVYVNRIVQVPTKVRTGHWIPEIGVRQTCEPIDVHANAEPPVQTLYPGSFAPCV